MTVDGRAVDEVLAPASIRELGEMIAATPESLAPVGTGTRLEFGNPLAPVGAVVDMKRLDRVTEYVPADMTIHLEAGATLGRLSGILAEHNQMLPLDPWCGPDATLGGVIATDSQGAFRTVGTIRDWIIGMSVVGPNGRASRTGGRVVKNVTGYDLAKLYTGSLGSLGIIAEVSLKLRSRYDRTSSASIRLPDAASAARMVRALRAAPLDPVSLVWSGPDHEIRIRFGEHRKAVAWQLGQLPAGDWEIFGGDEEARVWEGVRTLYHRLAEPVVRVVSRPSAIPDLLERFRPGGWLAHPARGVVLMTSPEEGIAELRKEFPVVLERAPLDLRRRVPTFGVRGAEYQTMRRLKQAFDPAGRFNPGRHVDGEPGP